MMMMMNTDNIKAGIFGGPIVYIFFRISINTDNIKVGFLVI